MENKNIQIGDIVTAIYKTGKYIGEVTGERESTYLVKILAVLKHPIQGDLHNPKQTDVAMFHTRRALAYCEQTNVPKNMVKSYVNEIPDYIHSLQTALETMKQELEHDERAWSKKSLEAIQELENDYFPQ
ncbi:MAG: kinase-associated lipoprotein B [Bacillus sp. (in: firmicutes)]